MPNHPDQDPTPGKKPEAPVDQTRPAQNIPDTSQATIENMEVHHHAHAHAGKKTWKNYFWEFLMLFLAVFCGFLAEYYLEHRIEKERGKQFIESFYNDLKTDTARMADFAGFDEQKVNVMGSIGHCYDTLLQSITNTSCILELIKHSSVNRPFARTERTLKQLANAGGFRLLPKEDADSIVAYDKLFTDFQDFQSTVFQNAQNNVRNTFNTLVNFKANLPMFKPEAGKNINTESFSAADITHPIFLTNDKKMLNTYFNELILYYRVTFNHRRMLQELKDQQIRLIHYFRKKYGFD